MSKQAREELLAVTRLQYKQANWNEKRVLLDAFTRATGYNRKHAIKLLGDDQLKIVRKRVRKPVYGEEVVEALKQVWLASNRIASKRLIPFLPVMLEKLEKGNHLALSEGARDQLLTLSAATADRLLAAEKKKFGRSKSTTRPGRLLKNHIPVRTFAEWDDVEPGFLEADLVSHCGGINSGLFLNTLTMTDIATGWTEMLPVFGKSEDEVLRAICRIAAELPFPLKGLDTDNGGEFINYATVNWCEKNRVTFTRSREYKKNDQAHVEEKNGSIVRRMVGYDRFQGESAWDKMNALYRVARLYVNFFQPSMKLMQKERDGARVRKFHDKAQTPHQRIMASDLAPELKFKVQSMYEELDPLLLLQQLERCQLELLESSRSVSVSAIAEESVSIVLAKVAGVSDPNSGLQQTLSKPPGSRPSEVLNLHTKSVSEQPSKAKRTGQWARMRSWILNRNPGESFWLDELTELGSRESARTVAQSMLKTGDIVRLQRGRYARRGEPEASEDNAPSTGIKVEDMRRYIFGLPPDQTFRAGDLMQFGSKDSVNGLLQSLLKRGAITRVSHGRYKTISK